MFAQLLSQQRLRVYREILASDTDIEHFAPEVHRLSGEWFPNAVKWFDIIDPTGFNRSQINKRSCAGVIKEKCFSTPEPGIASVIDRRKAVSTFLQRNVKGMPGLLIDGVNCAMLVSGFEGGYHFAEAKDGQLKEVPEKNEFSHPHDALQMIASKIERLDLKRPSSFEIPTPRYSFGKVKVM